MDTVYIMRRTYLTVILSVVFCACAFCREAPGKNRIRMAFYNTENMFDTLASKTYDDAEFTPSGKNAWDGRKYRTKIKNTARVLADMNADIIGLAEIENDGVLADLVGSLPAGYGYVHMETADNRGIDPALLYKKEVFSPVSWTLGVSPMNERGILHVKGVLKTTGDTLHVMENHGLLLIHGLRAIWDRKRRKPHGWIWDGFRPKRPMLSFRQTLMRLFSPAATLTTIRTMCRYRLCSACPRKCAATAMQLKHPDTIIRNNGIRLTRFI